MSAVTTIAETACFWTTARNVSARNLQMVPRRRPSAGCWPVCRIVPGPLCQTAAVSGVRKDICPAQAKHAILLHLCRRTRQTEQAGVGKEKPG